MRFLQKRSIHVLLFIVVSLCFTVVLAELGARWFFGKRLEQITFSSQDLYYYTDPTGRRHHIPNSKGYERAWNNEGKVPIHINRLGFRGRDVQVEKTPGVKRVLILGDSIAFGGRLAAEDTYLHFIEKEMARSGNAAFEFINAAMGDIGIAEQMTILKEKGIALNPDAVILFWYLNDRRPPVGFPEETIYQNPVIDWFHKNPWLNESYLASFLYYHVRQVLLNRQVKIFDVSNERFAWIRAYQARQYIDDPNEFVRLVQLAQFDWGDAWKKESVIDFGQRIVEMNNLCKERNISFRVVLLPALPQVLVSQPTTFTDLPQLTLSRICETEGIPYLNVLPDLREKGGGTLFYDHCHYTPQGNRVLGERVARFLLDI